LHAVGSHTNNCTKSQDLVMHTRQRRISVMYGQMCSTGPGFVMNNVHAKGAVIAYQNLWMMWKVPDISSIQPKHLAFAQLIKPAPDLIIFGSGAARVTPPRETLAWLRGLGTSFEILPTVRINTQNYVDVCQ